MITQLPFSGFYENQILEIADWNFDQDDPETSYSKEDYDKIDWQKAQFNLAKIYTEGFNREFEYQTDISLNLKFVELSSPRFYNFETDRIFAEISPDKVKELREYVSENILREMIKKECTSRDGFSSWYPNDLDDWPKLEDWDHNHNHLLLKACLVQADISEDVTVVGDIENHLEGEIWDCHREEAEAAILNSMRGDKE